MSSSELAEWWWMVLPITNCSNNRVLVKPKIIATTTVFSCHIFKTYWDTLCISRDCKKIWSGLKIYKFYLFIVFLATAKLNGEAAVKRSRHRGHHPRKPFLRAPQTYWPSVRIHLPVTIITKKNVINYNEVIRINSLIDYLLASN